MDDKIHIKPRVHCPRCKGVRLLLIEEFIQPWAWVQDEDGISAKGEALNPTGGKCLAGECEQCGYRWRVRRKGGAWQITDVYPETEL